MKKSIKSSKIKEPVRLRAKRLANGNRSLYLDTYSNGKRSYEFLKIYLIPEKTPADKALNAASLNAANAIEAERILALIHGKANIKDIHSQMPMTNWIAKMIEKKKGLRSRTSIGLMRRLSRHLEIHRPGARLNDIDRSFCIGFADYLRSASALNSKKTLADGTKCELLNALSIALNEAVRAELIPKNPMSLLNLFCCFCGLRYSDVVPLKWENIIDGTNGKEIQITMKKTKRPISIPLSAQAIALLPCRGKPEAQVFAFPSYAVTLRRLKKLAANAGITKKVTFHVSRHTFATMMLTAGSDLYTISKLVGHADIRTTQIYSKVVDRRKREAVALLDRLF